MPIRAVDPVAPDPDVVADAARVLRAGGLVAFPTETVYGLGAHALDAAAVQRIFAAKGRPSFNPLIAHVADVAGARALVRDWPDAAEALARAFWPGPLTLVLPKRAHVPDVLTAGLPAVAVRVPSHPVALALLRAAAQPIAAPSANRFTELSPTTARHVEKALGDRVDLILDGGPTSVGIESTVVDLTGDVPVLLRPGTVSVDAIAAVLGTMPARPAAIAGDAPRPAPGMVERHYAPRATVWLFDAHERGAIAARLRREAGGATVGALLLAPWDDEPAPDHPVRMPTEPAAYARRLYAALHELDDAGCAIALVERPPDTPAWHGVRDRLTRAAH
ncbi:MAG: L-threonylcarbamoyladenylate synthase [Gemmatirosa sp.]